MGAGAQRSSRCGLAGCRQAKKRASRETLARRRARFCDDGARPLRRLPGISGVRPRRYRAGVLAFRVGVPENRLFGLALVAGR